ncbi:unnamed protein product [marine sediment metagenome]|uniref:Uncharacterized protein n=1 Tax=marine sediment metagenome TaxID=412755 RepID=X1GGN4_9ZZZZ
MPNILKNGEPVFPGNGKQRLTPQEEENKRLKKELYDVKRCEIY